MLRLGAAQKIVGTQKKYLLVTRRWPIIWVPCWHILQYSSSARQHGSTGGSKSIRSMICGITTHIYIIVVACKAKPLNGVSASDTWIQLLRGARLSRINRCCSFGRGQNAHGSSNAILTQNETSLPCLYNRFYRYFPGYWRHFLAENGAK